MHRVEAAEDRVVLYFPRPYLADATPYEIIDFDQQVLEECSSADYSMRTNIRLSKVVIVGDMSVGKTCLVHRFCHNVFDANYKQTIGVDFEVERFDVLNTSFNLQIWDTAGQERFKCIAASYYRGAQVVLVVFDMSCISTLHGTPQWLKDTLENNQDLPLVYLIGTKKDLLDDASCGIVEEAAIKLARSIKAEYWTVSSKNGENVKDLFFRIAAMAFNRSVLKELEEYEPLPPANILEKKKSIRLRNSDFFEVRRKKSKCTPSCVKA